MRTISKMAAQGDVMFCRVERIPEDAEVVAASSATGTKTSATGSPHHILAHSETGHHHVVRADGTAFFKSADPFTCYLRVDGAFADIEHERPFDTHETIRLLPGSYLVRRQREYVPEGYRMVED